MSIMLFKLMTPVGNTVISMNERVSDVDQAVQSAHRKKTVITISYQYE